MPELINKIRTARELKDKTNEIIKYEEQKEKVNGA